MFGDTIGKNAFYLRYSRHITDYDANPDLMISVDTDQGLTPGYSPGIFIDESGEDVHITSGSMRYSFCSRTNMGSLMISDNEPRMVDSLENALRIVFQWLAITRGCVIVHAACIGTETECILLPAPESGGKSTIASLCRKQGGWVYGDDLVMIGGTDGDESAPLVYGLPFRGEEEFMAFPPEPAVLKEVLFPEKGKGCSVRHMNGAEAVARLISNIPYTRAIPRHIYVNLLSCAERIISRGAGLFAYDLESDPAATLVGRLTVDNEH